MLRSLGFGPVRRSRARYWLPGVDLGSFCIEFSIMRYSTLPSSYDHAHTHSFFLYKVFFTFIYFHIGPRLDVRFARYRSNIPGIYHVTRKLRQTSSLDAELGTAPVSALGVVLDGVVGTEADPLGKRAVLPLLLGKSALGTEGLLGRLLGETEGDEEGKKK